MSAGARIAALVVVAVVAFAGAFVVFGGGSDDRPAQVASGTPAPSSTTTAVGSGTGGGGAGGDNDSKENPCVQSNIAAVEEVGYAVTVATEPDPPKPRGTTFEIVVERDGSPVSGATVCLSADMGDMSHSGSSARADEVDPGRYEAAISFGMRGSWTGRVLVVEPGQRPASMPISFSVT